VRLDFRTSFTDCDAVREQSKKEVRLGDNKIRISDAWRAVSLAFGAWDPRVEGLALPKFVKSGNFSLNKLVIRSISV
jgi:hypothetical protein